MYITYEYWYTYLPHTYMTHNFLQTITSYYYYLQLHSSIGISWNCLFTSFGKLSVNFCNNQPHTFGIRFLLSSNIYACVRTLLHKLHYTLFYVHNLILWDYP